MQCIKFRSGKFFAQKDAENDCWEKGIFIKKKDRYFGYLCFKTSWVYIFSIPKVMIGDRAFTAMPMLSWRLGKYRGKTILLCQEIGMVEVKNPAAPVIAEQFAEGMASLRRSTAFWPDFGNSSLIFKKSSFPCTTPAERVQIFSTRQVDTEELQHS